MFGKRRIQKNLKTRIVEEPLKEESGEDSELNQDTSDYEKLLASKKRRKIIGKAPLTVVRSIRGDEHQLVFLYSIRQHTKLSHLKNL